MLIIGNHGTNEANVCNILKNGFETSIGNYHWYGEGVYFFIEGVNDNITYLAEQWAKDQAFDKKTKSYKYRKYAVLEAHVDSKNDRTVDLRVKESLEIVNKVRELVEQMCKCLNKKMNDNEIWKYMKNKFDIQIVIDNTYIKFSEDRKNKISSRVPNCTIMSVLDVNIINKDNIKLLKKGDI